MKSILTTTILVIASQLVSLTPSTAQTATLERVKGENIKPAEEFKEQEAKLEMPLQKNATLHIVSTNLNIDIRTWGENKIKILTNVPVDEASKTLADVDLLAKVGISMRASGNRIELNTRGHALDGVVNMGYSTQTIGGEVKTATATLSPITVTGRPTSAYGDTIHGGAKTGTATLSPITVTGKPSAAYSGTIGGEVKNVTSSLNSITVTGRPTSAYRGTISIPKRRVITIYIPETTKLDIDNKSADITLRNDCIHAKFDLVATNLDCQNITTLDMQAKYSNVNVGNITTGEIEFENGNFRATNINNLDIDSKSSTIEYEEGSNLYLRSERDNYSVESIGKVEGRKLYGDLRISKLINSFDLEGMNADVKIRNIAATVEKVKMVNQYADIRIPVKSLQDYKVDFEGSFSTVFAPFQKTVILQEKPVTKTGEAEAKATPSPGSVSGGSVSGLSGIYNTSLLPGSATSREIAPAKFTASVGENKQKQTSFNLVCNSCTIDFK